MQSIRYTVGDTTFEIDQIDGDGHTRTQAEIDSLAAVLLGSTDAEAAKAREAERAPEITITPAPLPTPEPAPVQE